MGNISGTPPVSGSGGAGAPQWDPSQDINFLQNQMNELNEDLHAGNNTAVQQDLDHIHEAWADLKAHQNQLSPLQQVAFAKLTSDLRPLNMAVQAVENDPSKDAWALYAKTATAFNTDLANFPNN